MTLAAHIAAALLLLAGVAGLYGAWRGRRMASSRRRRQVVAGWFLLAAGVALWCRGLSPDVAVAQAVTLAMLLALAAIGAHALTLRRAENGARGGGVLEPLARAADTGNRLARLAGSLIVVPALGLLTGLLWYALVPGDGASRLIGLAFAALLAAAAALVVLLASTRPARMLLMMTGLSFCLALTFAAVRWLPALAR